MQFAASATRDGWSRGRVRELHVPWPTLGRIVQPIGGQQVMVIAAPSVGKSLFALNWAARSGAYTLYQSADTDQRTMTESLAALATGHDRALVKQRLRDSETWRDLYAEAVRDKFPNLVMDFTSSPALNNVARRAQALVEVWGETPQLVVLDTASDVKRDGDSYDAWRRLWIAGRNVARYFNTVVMHLHHIKNGPARNGDMEPDQNDGKYGADEFPEIVMGLWRPDGNLGRVTATVLKNRAGKRMVRIPFEARYDIGAINHIE